MADKLWIAILFAWDSSPIKTCADSRLIVNSSTLLQKLILQEEGWSPMHILFFFFSGGLCGDMGKIN